jgi:GntR family transcriptional regulator
MTITWNNQQPIYRQLHDKMVSLILQGVYPEGSPLPSVRQVSADFQINHLTVAKAYQELVDLGVVEAKRGMGMYVLPGAQEKLHTLEKEKFLQQELPNVITRMHQLGISKTELINSIHRILQEEKS